MTKNVGTIDRVIRVVLAIVLGYLYFSGTVTGALGIILLIIGIILLFTGLIGFCALYKPLGISTCKKE
jgi:uncharacterized membrane protein